MSWVAAPTVLICIILSGCSIAAYTPVVGGAAFGYDRVSLKGELGFSKIIGAKITLEDTEEYEWTLRKFSKGRLFIEKTYEGVQSTRKICSLGGSEIEIIDVFEDRINGGIFYSANATCNGIEYFKTVKNNWSNDMLLLLENNTSR